MSEKPRRPWFRFHLLTAVLMMLATGIALLTNIAPRLERTINGNIGAIDYGSVGVADVVGISREYGFPFPAIWRDAYFSGVYANGFGVKSAMNLVADILIWLCLLIGVTLVSESILRRRNPPTSP
jgi:hypothetical protein